MIGKVFKSSDLSKLLDYVYREEKQPEVLSCSCHGISRKETFEAINHQIKQDKEHKEGQVVHITVSIERQRELEWEQWKKVAKEVTEELGLKRHAYVAIRHHDTDHEHIHIVASRVNEAGKSAPLSHDYHAIERVMRKLEHDLDLQKLPSRQERMTQPVPDLGRAVLNFERRTGEVSQKRLMQQAILEANRQARDARQWREMLAQKGVSVRCRTHPETGKIEGVSYARDGIHVPGYKLAKEASWPGLETKMGFDAQRDRHVLMAREPSPTTKISPAQANHTPPMTPSPEHNVRERLAQLRQKRQAEEARFARNLQKISATHGEDGVSLTKKSAQKPLDSSVPEHDTGDRRLNRAHEKERRADTMGPRREGLSPSFVASSPPLYDMTKVQELAIPRTPDTLEPSPDRESSPDVSLRGDTLYKRAEMMADQTDTLVEGAPTQKVEMRRHLEMDRIERVQDVDIVSERPVTTMKMKAVEPDAVITRPVSLEPKNPAMTQKSSVPTELAREDALEQRLTSRVNLSEELLEQARPGETIKLDISKEMMAESTPDLTQKQPVPEELLEQARPQVTQTQPVPEDLLEQARPTLAQAPVVDERTEALGVPSADLSPQHDPAEPDMPQREVEKEPMSETKTPEQERMTQRERPSQAEDKDEEISRAFRSPVDPSLLERQKEWIPGESELANMSAGVLRELENASQIRRDKERAEQARERRRTLAQRQQKMDAQREKDRQERLERQQKMDAQREKDRQERLERQQKLDAPRDGKVKETHTSEGTQSLKPGREESTSSIQDKVTPSAVPTRAHPAQRAPQVNLPIPAHREFRVHAVHPDGAGIDVRVKRNLVVSLDAKDIQSIAREEHGEQGVRYLEGKLAEIKPGDKISYNPQEKTLTHHTMKRTPELEEARTQVPSESPQRHHERVPLEQEVKERVQQASLGREKGPMAPQPQELGSAQASLVERFHERSHDVKLHAYTHRDGKLMSVNDFVKAEQAKGEPIRFGHELKEQQLVQVLRHDVKLEEGRFCIARQKDGAMHLVPHKDEYEGLRNRITMLERSKNDDSLSMYGPDRARELSYNRSLKSSPEQKAAQFKEKTFLEKVQTSPSPGKTPLLRDYKDHTQAEFIAHLREKEGLNVSSSTQLEAPVQVKILERDVKLKEGRFTIVQDQTSTPTLHLVPHERLHHSMRGHITTLKPQDGQAPKLEASAGVETPQQARPKRRELRSLAQHCADFEQRSKGLKMEPLRQGQSFSGKIYGADKDIQLKEGRFMVMDGNRAHGVDYKLVPHSKELEQWREQHIQISRPRHEPIKVEPIQEKHKMNLKH